MQQSLNTTQRRKIGNKPIQSAPPTPNTLALGVATVKRNKWGTSPFDEHWLNLDCCGLICAFVTWSLHIYAVYAVDFILLPPWMSTPEGSEMGRSMSFWGHFHRVAFTITAGLACIAHFYAMTTDPGAVPPDANPLPAPEEEKIVAEEASEEQILVAPTQTGRRLCRRCRTFKPQRAHHCSVCRRCIVKMDHHCPWVNNCVGIGNHKYFLLFVLYTFISCLYSLSLVVFRFVMCMHRVPGVRWKHMHCLDQPSHLLYILGLMVEAVLFGLFTSCMMVDQWDVVMSNVTHIDRLKGETGGDKVAGVTEVFGVPRIGRSTGFRCDWLSPVSKACFPPSIRDEILGYCRPCHSAEKEMDGVELGVSGGRMVRSVTEIV